MPMSDVTHATYRAKLEEEQGRIRAQLEQMGHGDARLSFNKGFADSGPVTTERGEVEALAGTLLETLADVDHALAKLDSGEYDLCESCEETIPEGQLEANPAARLCTDCA